MTMNANFLTGSQEALNVAKKRIPEALEVLEKRIKTAEGLQNSAVVMFKEDAEKFFDIMGSEAAKFARQKGEIEAAIVAQEEKMRKAIDELADLKGQVEKYHNLVHVAQVRVEGTEEAMKQYRERVTQMHAANMEVENAIRAIPQTVDQDETRPFLYVFSKTRTVRIIEYIKTLLILKCFNLHLGSSTKSR
jgi:chromosome segregation ATPase